MNCDFKMMVAGDLENGQHFQVKKDGKYYTVHCHVMSKPTNDEAFDRMHYILATDGKKLKVFDYEQKVIVCK